MATMHNRQTKTAIEFYDRMTEFLLHGKQQSYFLVESWTSDVQTDTPIDRAVVALALYDDQYENKDIPLLVLDLDVTEAPDNNNTDSTSSRGVREVLLNLATRSNLSTTGDIDILFRALNALHTVGKVVRLRQACATRIGQRYNRFRAPLDNLFGLIRATVSDTDFIRTRLQQWKTLCNDHLLAGKPVFSKVLLPAKLEEVEQAKMSAAPQFSLPSAGERTDFSSEPGNMKYRRAVNVARDTSEPVAEASFSSRSSRMEHQVWTMASDTVSRLIPRATTDPSRKKPKLKKLPTIPESQFNISSTDSEHSFSEGCFSGETTPAENISPPNQLQQRNLFRDDSATRGNAQSSDDEQLKEPANCGQQNTKLTDADAKQDCPSSSYEHK